MFSRVVAVNSKAGKARQLGSNIVIASLIFTINALTLGHLATPHR
jgi:hypothetical protein